MRTIASFSASVNSASASLLTTNARLLAMRAASQKTQARICSPDGELQQHVRNDVLAGRSAENHPSSIESGGWLSLLREAITNPVGDSIQAEPVAEKRAKSPASPTNITTFGTIATAILKHDGGTVGRLWLVLRANFAGEAQSGMVSADSLWSSLTANFPQYSKRYLSDLLNRGEGIYWQRDALGRLWLHGMTKLAGQLGVQRLQGSRVIIPLADLTCKLTQMRTALQAAFHASRDNDNPISRATLRDLTGISERSQREQENKNSGLIDSKPNYSLDGVAHPVSAENHSFRYQQNSFHFTDKKGMQGKQGVIHLAHQLPNSYTARYARASRGRKRKINRQLNRVNQGARGTEWLQIETVFCNDGATAVQQVNRGNKEVAYPACDTLYGTRIWITLRG